MQQYEKIDRSLVTENSFTYLTEDIASMDDSPIKILLAVASPEECVRYKSYLNHSSQSPFSIIEANSSQEAYVLCNQLRPQCVVFDYSLADAQTPEFIAKLTKSEANPKCGVVLLVQADSINAMSRQLKDGAPEFLCKDHLFAEQLQQAITDSIETGQKNRVKEIEKEKLEKAGLNGNAYAIVNALPEILFLASPDGNSDFINQRFYEYTGLTPEEARGSGWIKIVHPDDVEQTVAQWRESVETGKPFEGDFRLRGTQADYRWFQGRAVPLRDESGSITNWLGICTDITRQKEIEQERENLLLRERQARDLAEAANLAKDEFIALVSHELRTPLNAVLGWVNILQSQEVDKETFQHGLETIERSTKSQATLIEDLIDSAMIATGKMRTRLEKVNLENVIQSALDVVLPAAEAKSVSIKFGVEAHNSYVLGDASRLQQVVWNLLSNAVKFTPEGGLIDVTLKAAGGNAEIIVRDTGQGIHPEVLPSIFDRFQQADISRTRRFGGLGLGLALVKQLVELHGGTVRAESGGEALGATFTVSLPLRIKASGMLTISMLNALKKDEVMKDKQSSLSGLRVLVVDDDADALEISSIMLRQQGALVTQATSAGQAYALLSSAQKEHLPEVLVSDIGMPDEDGYSLIRRVRTLSPERGGGIPAVAVTAFTSAEDRRHALDTGFQAHLSKPIDTDEFIRVVARLTNRSLHTD
jgi:PAS domain S-box-containing protein